jgi:hypothetical protein
MLPHSPVLGGEGAAVVGATPPATREIFHIIDDHRTAPSGRGANIAESAKGAGPAVALCSRRAQSMPDIGDVADTLGELGLMSRANKSASKPLANAHKSLFSPL